MIKIDAFLLWHNTVQFSIDLPLSPKEFLDLEVKSEIDEYIINYLKDNDQIGKNESWSVDDYDVYDHEYNTLAENYQG